GSNTSRHYRYAPSMGVDPTNPPEELAADRFHSHCKRVAAWTLELAQARGLKSEEQDTLERAALSQHNLMSSLNGSGLASLLADVGVQEWFPQPPAAKTAPATPAVGLEILEIANALDEHFEWEPFSDLSEDDTNPAASAALACLRCVKDA